MKLKQQIYAEILREGILYIRNKSKDAAVCFTIADLLHNIPTNIASENFGEADLYFINIEASSYLTSCKQWKTTPNQRILILIEKLRRAVPEEMQAQIKPPHTSASG